MTHLPTGAVRSAQERSRANSLSRAMAALLADLDAMEASRSAADQNGVRKAQVGTGERADRRRLWAFQRGTVEDFRTGRSARLRDVLRGGFRSLWGR